MSWNIVQHFFCDKCSNYRWKEWKLHIIPRWHLIYLILFFCRFSFHFTIFLKCQYAGKRKTYLYQSPALDRRHRTKKKEAQKLTLMLVKHWMSSIECLPISTELNNDETVVWELIFMYSDERHLHPLNLAPSRLLHYALGYFKCVIYT